MPGIVNKFLTLAGTPQTGGNKHFDARGNPAKKTSILILAEAPPTRT